MGWFSWVVVIVVILGIRLYRKQREEERRQDLLYRIQSLPDEERESVIAALEELREERQAEIRESNAYDQRRREFAQFMSDYEKRK